MKKFLCLLVLISTVSTAQDIDTLVVDSLTTDTLLVDSVEKEPPSFYGAIFLSAEIKVAPHFDGLNWASSYGIGLQYNRWIIGFRIFDFQGDIEELLIFPNQFSLDYRFGGPDIGFELVKHPIFSADIIGSFRVGDMIWRDVEREVDFLRDEFILLSLGLSVDFDRIRYVKPYFTLGYQQMNGLVLERVQNNEFSGLFFDFGIRLGYFNQ